MHFFLTLRKNYIDEIRYIVYTNEISKYTRIMIDAYCINKFTMLSMGISMEITVPKEIYLVHDK